MQTRRIVGVGMLISGLLAGVTQAATSASAPPPRGGTITIGELGGLPGLDPIGQTFGYPEAGGIELAAIYDTLMRFDPDAGVYEPQLAAGLEPNDDFSEWTLSLRPDVTFTDATMLDAEAVRASILRHTDPSARSAYRAAIGEFVQEMSVADPLTLVFTLAKPWSGFPVMLASTVGMITSPTAVEAAGEDFATSPGGAGAGPFMVDSFKPGEDIIQNAEELTWLRIWRKMLPERRLGVSMALSAMVEGMDDVA